MLDHVDHGHGLDVQHMAVVFHIDLMACGHLLPGEHAVAGHELHVFVQQEGAQGVGGGGQIGKAPALGLGHPGAVIAVAAEDDAPVL